MVPDRGGLLRAQLLSAGAMCALLAALVFTRGALADVAPPEQPPGSNIGPAGQTQVRMNAETVVLDVQPYQDIATAKVTGDFTMHNTGQAEERMKVRFPLGGVSGQGNGFGQFPEVVGFAVTANGQKLTTTIVTTPNANDPTHPIRWAAFDVAFPPGQDVPIQVTYSITSTGYAPAARFAYVLETGAGWKDTIGSVDVVLRLPYAATTENVFAGDSEKTTPGAKLSGNEVRWHYDNLEPTSKDNIRVTILAPKAWQGVLDAQSAVQAKPGDATALAALARAYNAGVTSKFPYDEHDPFARLADDTYEKALALKPDDAALHAEYAKVIWDHITVQASPGTDDPQVRRVLTQISLAITLDPNNADAKALLKDVQGVVQTPVVLPTVTIPSALPTGSVEAINPTPTAPPPLPTGVPTTAPTTQPPTQVPTTEPTIEQATATSAPVPATPTAAATPTTPPANPPARGDSTNNVGLIVALIAVPIAVAVAAFALVAWRTRART